MPHKDPEARRQYEAARYAAKVDDFKAAAAAHYAANGDRIRAERAASRTSEAKAANAASMRERHRRLRCEMIAAYGAACQCCGEAEPLFLELDHIASDGGVHRRVIGRGSAATYRWLRTQGWPRASHQLLCANCNQGRARNGGVCPHEQRSSNHIQRGDDPRSLERAENPN